MMSRILRVVVEYGNIEYSAVSQPPVTFCSFIQRGTISSIITPQITRVLPMATSTEPLACGAMFKSKLIERIWSDARPSERCMKEQVAAGHRNPQQGFRGMPLPLAGALFLF